MNKVKLGMVARMQLRDWSVLLSLGMVSAIISVATPAVSSTWGLAANGAVFGTAICVFLLDQRQLLFFPNAVAMIGVSTLAWWASFYGASLFILIPWPASQRPVLLPFAGGVIGGSVLLTALFAFVLPQQKILKKVTFGALLSGILGVVGYLLGPSLGHALWRLLPRDTSPEYLGNEGYWDYSTIFVWQVCMAIYIGYATQPSGFVSEAQSPQENAERNSGSWATTRATIRPQRWARSALVAVLGVCFAVVMVITSKNRRERAVEEAFDKSVWAQMPPAVHLADVSSLLPEQVLVLRDIGPLYATEPQIKYEKAVDLADERQPNSICYRVEYALGGAVTVPAVIVSVTEYPNEEWPQFLAKYDAPIGLPPEIRPLTEKFGNKMRTNGALYSQQDYPFTYEWPSGKNKVTVTYEPRISWEQDDQVLKIYLEKYPSSIR